MKVLVPAKHMIDSARKVRVTADGAGVGLAKVIMPLPPFDKIAVE